MYLSLLLLIVFTLVIVFTFVIVNITLSVPSYRGEKSDHFDGEEFQNMGGAHEGQFRDLMRWAANRKPGMWQHWVDIEQKIPPEPSPDEVVVTLINHSSWLIQTPNLVFLTDPVYSDRVSPFSFAGPKRNKLPGIALQDLPKVDFILLSHNHYDHLDVGTLRKLCKRDKPKILCPLGNARFLVGKDIHGAKDLDWWDSAHLKDDIWVDCVPAQHFSGRSMFDRNQSLWSGFVIQLPKFGNIYYAGDTGYGLHFNHIAQEYDSFRVGIIPIGAYKPEWFMSPIHVSPKEAVVIHKQLNIETSLATHFGTFNLADDGENEPAEELNKLLKKSASDFRIPENGESFVFEMKKAD